MGGKKGLERDTRPRAPRLAAGKVKKNGRENYRMGERTLRGEPGGLGNDSSKKIGLKVEEKKRCISKGPMGGGIRTSKNQNKKREEVPERILGKGCLVSPAGSNGAKAVRRKKKGERTKRQGAWREPNLLRILERTVERYYAGYPASKEISTGVTRWEKNPPPKKAESKGAPRPAEDCG